MKQNLQSQNQVDNLWISATGYRILLELNALLQSPKSSKELIEIIKNSSVHINISDDTIRFDINTLRNAGCVISKPEKSSGYKFRLISHPFKFTIDNRDINNLIHLRDVLAANITFDEAFVLNDLFQKIFSLTLDNEQCQIIL